VIYVDTSVLVPLFTKEPQSAAVSDWYERQKGALVSAIWCVTEFASALGIKQRTGQIDAEHAAGVWARFERMAGADLRLIPIEPAHFNRAAQLVLDASSALRAGDALHLACAEGVGAKGIATLDEVMGRNAHRLKIKPEAFGSRQASR
jgi:predicted nucleic acid-binding protein